MLLRYQSVRWLDNLYLQKFSLPGGLVLAGIRHKVTGVETFDEMFFWPTEWLFYHSIGEPHHALRVRLPHDRFL